MTSSDMDRIADLAGLARSALCLWDVPQDATVRLINLSENATYLVESPPDYRSVLRVHRQGYHSHRAIECELAWMAALDREGGVETARPIPGRDGAAIQTMDAAGVGARRMVMFEFLEGKEPDPDQNLIDPFRQLGAIAARTHLHSMSWTRPDPFERLVWDDEAVFGPAANWGNWRDAPALDADAAATIDAAEMLVRARLADYGRQGDRYGLIHADMRLANLLIDGGRTRLIDFDDCGLGWFMYDFAAGISFMEHHPQVPALRQAWLEGYQDVRPLSDVDKNEIDSFIMLRRLALLAWIGSHSDTDLARSQAPHFATVSARLARDYLDRRG
ncbi:phosphotransferase enzyme family protein [Alphaproteobacteria bacterium LSUCC0719]